MATLGSDCDHDEFDTSMEKRSLEIDTHQRSLPDHLIIDNILPRLPVKPLTRFKTVCKFWHSIISSSQFTESHLKFSSLRPLFVVATDDLSLWHHRLFLLPCDPHHNDNDVAELGLDRKCDVIRSLDIVGSCNGLLCLFLQQASDGYEFFCVWNPATHQFREIKNPVGVAMGYDYGFGYVSSIDDYKIVGEGYTKINDIDEFFVFSLRKGKWKRVVELDELYTPTWFDNRDVLCRDTSSLSHKSMNAWQEGNKHMSWFDLVDDEFKQIPWIDCFSQYKRGEFFEMKDACVSFHCEHDQGYSDVWVLKQFGDENSWEKRFSFDLRGMSFLNFTHTGICLAKDGPGQLKVIASNQESPEETRVSAHFSGLLQKTAVYVESFISPFLN